jgi:hypothetical protein
MKAYWGMMLHLQGFQTQASDRGQCHTANHFRLGLFKYNILSRVTVIKMRVWIDNFIYCILTGRNYNSLLHYC